MYEKLVKQLQYCAMHNCTHEGEIEVGCTAPYEHREGITTCSDVLMLQAADAIEERCQQVDKFVQEATKLYSQLPHWIPVRERFPKKSGNYLTILGCVPSPYGGHDVMYVNEFMHPSDWLSEEGRKFHPNGKWYEDGVTYWMELPEPPKEEE